MRFVHTADWHLGRTLHGARLIDDQALVLDQIVALVREARADALIVAGDIYDRAVPPPEAVALLDDVLSRVILDVRAAVILIAGNHDSADRLGFGSRLLARAGLHVAADVGRAAVPVVLGDGAGAVHVYAVPFAEPCVVRGCRTEAASAEEPRAIADHGAALAAILNDVRAARAPGVRTVAVAHAFVAGGAESESERPLSVGGAGSVDPTVFEGFSYVALGHLHRPQRAGAEEIQYAGSPLAYSFSEAGEQKSAVVVEMDERGTCRAERVPLAPRRRVRCIEGTMDALLRGPSPGESRDDYIRATILDRGAILDPMGKLRAVYPNVLLLERPALLQGGAVPRAGAAAREGATDEESLFASFFEEVTGAPLGPDEAEAFQSALEDLRRVEREVAA